VTAKTLPIDPQKEEDFFLSLNKYLLKKPSDI
jgi:hypothetical protein